MAMNIRWSEADWSYMLGVIHGDGSIMPRSISISVGYRDFKYKDILFAIWKGLGFAPKLYRPRSAFRIDVHSAALRNMIAPLKVRSRWKIPKGLNVPHYLAGAFDTDGCVSRPAAKSISIGQKANGNLALARRLLISLGFRDVIVRNYVHDFHGKPYPTQTITLSGMDRLLLFSDLIPLRHPTKAKRLREMRDHIIVLQSKRPLWFRVGKWIQQEGDKTWEEVAAHFGLTNIQFNGAMQNLKRHADVEVIPPPKMLNKYRVRGRLVFRGR